MNSGDFTLSMLVMNGICWRESRSRRRKITMAISSWKTEWECSGFWRTRLRKNFREREGDDRHRHVTIATGKAAAPSLEKHMQKIREKYPNVQAEVITIINYFFGESITVSGLITGKDLMEQLEGRDLGDCLLLPCNMLRSGKNVFLDDVTVEEVEERLKTPVQIIDEPGSDLVKAVVEENQETIHRRRTMYEQADCSNCGPAERG